MKKPRSAVEDGNVDQSQSNNKTTIPIDDFDKEAK